MNKITYLSKQELEDLYIKKRLSTVKISKIYNCSKKWVRDLLLKFGIKLRQNIKNELTGKGWKFLKKKVTCNKCGEIFEVAPFRLKKSKKFIFCSEKCAIDFKKESPELFYGNYQRKKVPCKICGTEKLKKPSKLKNNKHFFCSPKCHNKFREGIKPGSLIPKICHNDECNKDIMVERWLTKKQEKFFCSNKCVNLWQSKFLVGDKRYNFKGKKPKYYGPSWSYAQKKCRIRDKNKCKNCEKNKEQNMGKNMDVHHILSFQLFGVENHYLANNLNNLICLCHSCHTIFDSQITSRIWNPFIFDRLKILENFQKGNYFPFCNITFNPLSTFEIQFPFIK